MPGDDTSFDPPRGAPELRVERDGTGFAAAIVDGFDPDVHAAAPAVRSWLQRLLWHHGVLCLRQPAKLTDEQHRAIVEAVGPVKELVTTTVDGATLRYGETKQHIDSGYVLTDADDLPELAGADEGGNDVRPGLFEFFHTDDSYVADPAAATVLHARALPAGGGGATRFLDMRAAFALLDEAEQVELEGLRAVHAFDNHDAFPPRPRASGHMQDVAPVAHPVVRAHPVTGTPALYFDLDRARGVEGMGEADGRELLQHLQDHAEAEAPAYAHEWRPFDVLLWDNASVQHRGGGDFVVGEQRRFWRYMVAGSRPEPYRSPLDA